jgi:hypothetical protein
MSLKGGSDVEAVIAFVRQVHVALAAKLRGRRGSGAGDSIELRIIRTVDEKVSAIDSAPAIAADGVRALFRDIFVSPSGYDVTAPLRPVRGWPILRCMHSAAPKRPHVVVGDYWRHAPDP